MRERERIFIEEIIKLSKKHALSISHEDKHGSFIIEDLKESNLEWLSYADIDTNKE